MGKGRSIWEHMLEENAPDAMSALTQTIIEIAGHKRVLIENHRGIICYGKERITIKVKNGSVSICGNGLEMLHMTKEHLVIFGTIHTVTLHRRDQS